MKLIEDDLRSTVQALRRTPMAITVIVPLLQQAADTIEKLRSRETELLLKLSACDQKITHDLDERLELRTQLHLERLQRAAMVERCNQLIANIGKAMK